jgi:hypothetical protein
MLKNERQRVIQCCCEENVAEASDEIGE